MNKPQFVLNEVWAIGTNRLNWILYTVIHGKKEDTPDRWRIVGHYPSAMLLLTDMHRQISLVDSGETDIEDRLDKALLTATANLSAFAALIDAMGRVPDKAYLSGPYSGVNGHGTG